MDYIDIPAIEQYARQLRAQEIQRVQGLVGQRVRLYAVLLGNSLQSLLETVGEILRPLFSWNPQAEPAQTAGPSLLIRTNRVARALFAWNPRRRHSC